MRILLVIFVLIMASCSSDYRGLDSADSLASVSEESVVEVPLMPQLLFSDNFNRASIGTQWIENDLRKATYADYVMASIEANRIIDDTTFSGVGAIYAGENNFLDGFVEVDAIVNDSSALGTEVQIILRQNSTRSYYCNFLWYDLKTYVSFYTEGDTAVMINKGAIPVNMGDGSFHTFGCGIENGFLYAYVDDDPTTKTYELGRNTADTAVFGSGKIGFSSLFMHVDNFKYYDKRP